MIKSLTMTSIDSVFSFLTATAAAIIFCSSFCLISCSLTYADSANSQITDISSSEKIRPLSTSPSPVTPEEILSAEPGTVFSPDQIPTDDRPLCFTSCEIAEGDEVYSRIIGKSYRENEHIGLSDLRYLRLLHYNFDGLLQTGEMIVNKEEAENVLNIFRELLDSEYEIYSIYLVDRFWTGDSDSTDTASMEADNTSCFHYRAKTGGGSISNHALGRAIDLNPLENPYVKTRDGVTVILPEAGEAYLDRDAGSKHVITHQDTAYAVFEKYGYDWGGDWSSLKDYQHFEKADR